MFKCTTIARMQTLTDELMTGPQLLGADFSFMYYCFLLLVFLQQLGATRVGSIRY